jgi:hypothetical protein
MPFPVLYLSESLVLGIASMNSIQQGALAELARRLGHSVTSRTENGDCVFVDVEGVTVTIGVLGAYSVPSVRTYAEGLGTAADARLLWEKQNRRDSRDLAKARNYATGHLNPVVNANWQCSGAVNCLCRDGADLDRRRHRSFRKS